MKTVVAAIIAVIIGFLIGISLTFIFKKLPESWLQDYDYDPKSPKFRLAKRMNLVPHGIFAGIFCCAFYLVAVIFFKDLLDNMMFIRMAAILLIVPVLFLILISDKLNRIIPDQFSIFIGIFGLILLASDYLEKNIWFSSEARWFMPLINRFGAALLGAGVLFLIGLLGELLFSKESMGHGDIKLIAACGLCTGLYGLIVLIYVSVFSALLFAIPLLVKKQKRVNDEKRAIKESDDPIKARMEINIKKAQTHYAEDPDYLAFGPFLALGCGVFVILEPVFFNLMIKNLTLLGLYF